MMKSGTQQGGTGPELLISDAAVGAITGQEMMTMTEEWTKKGSLTGHAAIDLHERVAEVSGWAVSRLSKFGDPIEGPREEITVDEAREIASEDPSLVYLDLAPGAPIWDEDGESHTYVSAGDEADTLICRSGRGRYYEIPISRITRIGGGTTWTD